MHGRIETRAHALTLARACMLTTQKSEKPPVHSILTADNHDDHRVADLSRFFFAAFFSFFFSFACAASASTSLL